MKEMGLGIETSAWVATLSLVVGTHRCGLASVGPPLAGSLSGRRDHGVQQHKLRDRYAIAGQRCAESTHRLRDQSDGLRCPSCGDNGASLIIEGGPGPVRQGNRNTVEAGFGDKRLNPLPISGIAACPGN